MPLDAVIEDLEQDPHRPRSFYEYPALYDFYHSRVLDRDAQVGLLRRYEPEDTTRVLEFGCGTGPLLTRIEDEYETVLGIDVNEAMLAVARERVTTAEVREADFTAWSAADDGLVFDVSVLLGGMLHLTDDREVAALAENACESLRDDGAFVTFFQPFSDDVENGSRDVQTAESDRYSVERHSTSALTSADGHYTTTYQFVIRDEAEDREVTMGTVFEGRFHDPDALRETFADAGFSQVAIHDGDGPTTLHAVK
ncbi:class I SAM-dependent DNA methyltransferase [Haloarchaeobius amylolyticus]|uniref:class I SAM-dependent DNA methyltransferase n=1 Tax=Haloarchaeobius amylolyticus TaxID=1198296 RepID=UPI00226F82C5|nr:class I SAM-dependent methyltransferase [Haloarchaeobius amylolyticus]